MTDRPPSDRFRSEMPEIPGVSDPVSRVSTASNPAMRLLIGVLAVLLFVFLERVGHFARTAPSSSPVSNNRKSKFPRPRPIRAHCCLMRQRRILESPTRRRWPSHGPRENFLFAIVSAAKTSPDCSCVCQWAPLPRPTGTGRFPRTPSPGIANSNSLPTWLN